MMTPAFIQGAVQAPLRTNTFAPTSITARRPARRSLYTRPILRAQAEASPPSAPAATSTEPAADAVPDAAPAAPAATSPAPTVEKHVAPTPENSTFLYKFDDLRGKPVEPVSEAMARFNSAFKRPVPIVYRAIINEMISTTHLACVCAMWRFDAVFAFGFDAVFSNYLKFYPNEDERKLLYTCAADSLRIDPNVVDTSASAVSDWLDGKTEQDIFDALAAASPGATADAVGPVIEALAYIRDAGEFDWYYSRLFGLGLIQVMSKVGVELTVANAEIWAQKIGLQSSKFTTEMGSFLSSMERLKQAEQIFAEATAREAKKTAERLSAKAQKAADEATALEKGEDIETEEPAKTEGEEKSEDSA